MKSQVISAYGAPLRALERPSPVPQGSEVVLQVTHCGVCHSDVHLQDGYFALGGEKKLDLSASHSLPFTLGHEIEGVVTALGPQAQDNTENPLSIGARKVVYPWIGCGECPVCARGDEQLCNTPRALGVNIDGGYSDTVVVPHPRYLLDCDGIPAGLAATYMCSGLTAYSALKKIGQPASGEQLAIVGLGGVGMMGLQCARALFPDTPLVAVDVDDSKLQAALDNGAAAAYNATDKNAVKQLLKATGGVAAAVDFVGSEASLGFANRAVRKGGKVIIVGLFGGAFSMPIPLFPLRAISLIGSYVGTLAETRELLELAKTGRLQPIPIAQRPLTEASQTLDDLRAGRVLGRVVLDCSRSE